MGGQWITFYNHFSSLHGVINVNQLQAASEEILFIIASEVKPPQAVRYEMKFCLMDSSLIISILCLKFGAIHSQMSEEEVQYDKHKTWLKKDPR